MSVNKRRRLEVETGRSEVKRCMRLFQIIYRNLLREAESNKNLTDMDRNQIDMRTVWIMVEMEEMLNKVEPVVGMVPGVEVGDEYYYRGELSVLGLHRSLQGGIDSILRNGKLIATSILISSSYSDKVEDENVLICISAKPEYNKLERDNLALRNSLGMKTPVRVVHERTSSNAGKIRTTFTYDGLYEIEEYWCDYGTYIVEGEQMTSVVFRFRLRRLEGQLEGSWYKLKRVQESTVQEGLCLKDISLGREKLPICVINTIDNKELPQFYYITKTVYPSGYQKSSPKGCKCKDQCSDVEICSCAAKNGGQIPFTSDGTIVQAKPIIYECGPTCGCPPSCYNRVSQNGLKFSIEVFKTERRGWGLRPLCSIPSGSFVCEYIGVLLGDQEAEQRNNDEYLFDIGLNCDDSALLLSDVPGICVGQPSTDKGVSLSEGDNLRWFTIDALEMGNVGRFVNHSCSPNLYAQKVLFDHDDEKTAHIMFFAAENIPPLQELTCHYNYSIGSVHDSGGNVKVKECYCGTSECKGRLY